MLQNYQTCVAKWQAVRAQIMISSSGTDYSSPSYGGFPSTRGRHSDPVVRRLIVQSGLRAASEYLLGQVRAVIEVYLTLKNSDREEEREMFLVLERYFGEHAGIESIAREIGLSARTLYRRKEELIARVESLIAGSV